VKADQLVNDAGKQSRFEDDSLLGCCAAYALIALMMEAASTANQHWENE
jgi:hypothetical protein